MLKTIICLCSPGEHGCHGSPEADFHQGKHLYSQLERGLQVNSTRWGCSEVSTEICELIAMIEMAEDNAEGSLCAEMCAQDPIVGLGPGHGAGTKWVWRAPSSLIIPRQKGHLLFLPPAPRGGWMDSVLLNKSVVEQTAAAAFPLQIPRLVMDVERGFHMCVLWYLLCLMDCTGVLTGLSSNKIKSNFHLMKSLTFSTVFSPKKLLKIRACF